jgi:PAS domain S-box-containing protein
MTEVDTRQRFETLGNVARALSSALTLEDVARIVVERGVDAAKADTCTLYSLNDQTGLLELIAEHGCSPVVIEKIRNPKPETHSPIYETIRDGKPIWAETPEDYAAYDESLANTNETRARAFWSVPLIAEGRAIGLLGMGFYAPRRFSEDERSFIATFAHQFAEAMVRARRLASEHAARAAAENARASLITTLRSIGDAVIATDAEGAITLMNPVAETLTGWPEAEARGRALPEVFHIINEHTRALVPSPVDKVFESGTVVGLANHTLLVARDGREIPIDDSGAPIRREGGDIDGVILVFRDVTEKKHEESRREFLQAATALLSESLDYQTTLAKVAQLAVPKLADWCAVDIVETGERRPKRLSVAHVDPAKIELAKELAVKYPPSMDAPTGVPRVLRTGESELYEAIPEELIIAGCVDEEHVRIALALSLRSAMIVPLVARDRVLGVITFVYAESGRNYTKFDLSFAEELAHRCAVAIDNARLYASETQARLGADIANRAKDEFLAVVSHELRTPLNAIMGWAKMMSMPQFDEARRARALETIQRNSVAMAQLIEDLLDISRIISGKMRVDVQQVDLAGVIQAAIDSVKPAADAKGVGVTAVLDTTIPFVSGDSARLQQIVWNLLSNAVKFTPKNGRVDVTLERLNSWAEITVSDSGKGITTAFLAHVFESFRQEDAGHSRTRGGLGLGLAITRQLVELHGGTVEARSDGENKGATFVVRLPIASIAKATTAKSSDGTRKFTHLVDFERPPQLNDLRVLVVDDEEDARHLVQEILRQCGCNVRLAANVIDAMKAMAEEIPDVLISDIAMPNLDGYELIRRVRSLSRGEGGDVPAAALTAYARAEDRKAMLNAGFSMHVAKPVEPAELVAVVASLTRFSMRRG